MINKIVIKYLYYYTLGKSRVYDLKIVLSFRNSNSYF